MIRIRDTNRQLAELHDRFRFVEICDLSGKIAMLIYMDDAGVVHTARAGDPMATRYAAMMKTEFCEIKKI